MNDDKNQYWTMNVQAMVLDDCIGGRDVIRNWKFDYRRMDSFLSPEQDPFGNNQNVKERGIWLRWILPPELRKEQEDGSFQVIPNRYLITRVSEKTGKIVSKILEADCPLSDCMDDESYRKILPYTTIYLIGEQQKERMEQSPDPWRQQGYYEEVQKKGGYYVNLGVPFPLETWRERDTGGPFLTACAPGNPDFTGYIRFHSNMLAFFDDLKDCEEDVFHYSVIGWYSSGEMNRNFYSGQIFSVKWRKEGYPVRGIDDPYADDLEAIRREGKINVFIGENGQDTFRTWLKKHLLKEKKVSKEEEQVLEWLLVSFLSGNEEKQGETDYLWALRDKLQEEKFEAAYGGSQKTKALDEAIAVLHSRQEELQAIWWKKGYLDCHLDAADAEIKAGLEKELDVENEKSVLNDTIKQLKKVKELYVQYGYPEADKKSRQMGRYWRSKNPNLFLSGMKEPKDWDRETLVVREKGQLCREMRCTVSSAEDLPEGVVNLYQEAFYIMNHVYRSQGKSCETLPGYPIEPWHQPWQPAFLEWRICYEEMESFQFNGCDYEAVSLGKENPQMQSGYSGRITLDGHKKELFLEALERMKSFLPEEQMQKIKRAVMDWKLMSQELTGLNEQLGQRDTKAFRRPYQEEIPGTGLKMETILGYTSEDLDFLERVGAMGESVPCVRAGRIPKYRLMRKGKGYLKDLFLYDAFGRTLELIDSGDQKGIHSCHRFPLIIADSMRGKEKEDGYGFLLKPSILQSSRLFTRFLKKNESPFLGFIIPEFLGHSLLVYCSQGEALGRLLLLAAESGKRRVCFEWRAEESRRDAIKEENRELFQFIQAMQERTEKEFSLLLDAVEASFWTMEASGSEKQQRRALLAGRPLALSKIAIYLQYDGNFKKDVGWKKQEVSDYENQRFPVRLGNPAMREDGLTGYFSEDFSTFFSIAKPEIENDYLKVIGETDELKIGFQKERSLSVYLLYDPLLAVHIYTGILPVKRIWQEKKNVLKIMDGMKVTLRRGPVTEKGKDGKIRVTEGSFSLEPKAEEEKKNVQEKGAASDGGN